MRFKEDPNGDYEMTRECYGCGIGSGGPRTFLIRKRETNRMPELKPGMAVKVVLNCWRTVAQVTSADFRYWFLENEDVSPLVPYTDISAIKDFDGKLIWERDK